MDNPKTAEQIVGELASTAIVNVTVKGTSVPISQVLEEIAPQGTRVKRADLIGIPIVIYTMHAFLGEYGPALFIVGAVAETGELFNVIIGNKVLMPKLAAVRDHLPVSCTIIKKETGGKEYYDVI